MTDPAEQTAWHRRAVAVLAALLGHAAETGLPPLQWTVDAAGCGLAGRSLDYPQDGRRAVIQAWADALGAEVKTTRQGGQERLTVLRERRTDGLVRDPVVRIVLAADIWTDQEEGSSDG